MSSSRQNDTEIDDIFSYMCSLAVAKCSKKSEKKKASCGGAAMRKRLLIKNFVTQMLDQERKMSSSGREQLSREVNIPGRQRSHHHSKNIQTQIQDEDQMEEEVDDIDEGVDEEEYQPAEPTDFSDEEPLDEVTSDDEDLDDHVDSLNNNSKLDSKQLPGIGSLDLDAQNRPFGPNPYLSVDSSLSTICDDDSTDLSDDLSSESFELFGSKSSSTTAPVGLKQAPPSWHEPEADLFLLERSTPSLYYDDYSSVQTAASPSDSYGLNYRHDDFSAPTTTLAPSSDHYHLSTSVTDTTSSFLISSSNAEHHHSVPSVHTLLTNELSTRHPTQLPENFMDDTLIGRNELSNVTSIASSLTTSISTTTSYAELHTTQAIHSDATSVMTPSGGYHHANYACNNELDSTTMATSIDLCVEEKANSGNSVVVVDQNEDDEDASDNEDEQQRSAFVDLINIVPSPVNKMRMGDCRTEALQESCFGQSRHITDLDTQLTLIEDDEFSDVVNNQLGSHHLMMSDTKLSAAILDYDPLLLQSSPSLTDLIGSDVYSATQQQEQNMPVSGAVNHSPRKRLSQLDYGLMFNKALSPKRIKLKL